jgi:hypothetical protein
MAKKRNLTLILILLFPLALTATAQQRPDKDSAETLYKYCGGGANTWSESYCFRYVTGVLESAKEQGRMLAICQPKGATKGQVVDAVRTWLANQPKARQASAESLITKALSETWPCR